MGIDVRLGICAGAAAMAVAGTASAQVAVSAPDSVWRLDSAPALTPRGDYMPNLDNLISTPDLSGARDFAPAIDDTRTLGVSRRQEGGVVEQFRVRRTETISPLPEAARFDQDQIDVRYTRGWSMVSGDADGVQLEVTPHAGVSVGSDGGAAEAGATVRVGRLEVRDGQSYDDDQGRWYLFAAGSGTAVGMNWIRGADGWGRQMTHDSGSFIGDAQVGVAWRQGDTQASFGYVHREYTAEGVQGGSGIDRDATQGFVAFQFSIRPDW